MTPEEIQDLQRFLYGVDDDNEIMNMQWEIDQNVRFRCTAIYLAIRILHKNCSKMTLHAALSDSLHTSRTRVVDAWVTFEFVPNNNTSASIVKITFTSLAHTLIAWWQYFSGA